MGDRETFQDRLNALRLDVNALEEVRVHVPVIIGGVVQQTTKTHVIPNAPQRQGSLQVYAAITSNDGYIDGEGARRGLGVFGEELRADARKNSGKHPNIDLLETITELGDKLRCDVVRRNSEATLPSRVADAIPRAIASGFKTPFIILDEQGVRGTLKGIYNAFSWNEGFKEFFPVKAFPNPRLLGICREEGAGADCSSAPELDLAEEAGIFGEGQMFSSNNTSAREFGKARSLGSIINFDDITHIGFFERNVGTLPNLCCVRYNPGEARVGNSIIGNPVEAKYGMTREQVFGAFKMMKQKGVRRFGLHTMIASNELNAQYHVETARMLFRLAIDVKKELGIDVEFVNTGGGWGVGYKPEQRQISPQEIGREVEKEYAELVEGNGLAPIKVFMENGRFVSGPHGWLVSTVRHIMKKHRDYVGVDATMADFMRPGVYGAYHHAILLGKQNHPHNQVYDVVGSLCENSDKFAVNRALPKPEVGDLFVLCGAGAHGRAMGFNYNGKLRCGELLLRTDGEIEMIRRVETEKDYFATLNFPGSRFLDLAK